MVHGLRGLDQVAALTSHGWLPTRQWLARTHYVAEGKAPGTQAIQDAIAVLEGEALFEDEVHPVSVRLAEHEDAIYLDLGDSSWAAVEITAAGWRVVDWAPVRFRRAGGMAALPRPVTGGSLAELRELVNVGEDADWTLLVSWLVGALRPRGPYPILALHGEQGSAKSTTARLLRAIVDPSTAALRSEPRDAQNLMVAATNGWVIALDNLSFDSRVALRCPLPTRHRRRLRYPHALHG